MANNVYLTPPPTIQSGNNTFITIVNKTVDVVVESLFNSCDHTVSRSLTTNPNSEPSLPIYALGFGVLAIALVGGVAFCYGKIIAEKVCSGTRSLVNACCRNSEDKIPKPTDDTEQRSDGSYNKLRDNKIPTPRPKSGGDTDRLLSLTASHRRLADTRSERRSRQASITNVTS